MRTSVYFPGLNTLRFYAALSVVFGHLPPGENRTLSWFWMDARDAVTLFFVLSGFLIIHMLLAEKRTSGTIDVQRFYIRRALRILPLYYIVVTIGLIANAALTPTTATLCLVMLPNVGHVITSLGWLGHLWSIGVEEQFYATSPLLLRAARRPGLALGGIIAFNAGLVIVFDALAYRNIHSPFIDSALVFATSCRYGVIALGGIGALMVLRKHRLLRLIYARPTQIAAWAIALAAIALDPAYPWVTIPVVDSVMAVVFLVIILNVATNPRPLIALNWRHFDPLGDLTYAIYMTHGLVMVPLEQAGVTGLTLVVLSVAGVLVLAVAVRRLVEAPFLRLRSRWSPSHLRPMPNVQVTP